MAVGEFEGAVKITKGDGARQQVDHDHVKCLVFNNIVIPA